jgi:undecaprenyl-diphosphatase
MPFPYAFDPFLFVQRTLEHPWLDPIMTTATQLCAGWVVALLAVVWAASTARTRAGMVRAALPILLALAVDGVLVEALKIELHLPRPLAVLGPQQVHVLLAPLRAQSMPSGHASAAATFASYLWFRRRREAVVAGPVAVLGGVSRVYVGAHWVFDVLAGWIVGALVGWAAARLAARRSGLGAAPAPTRAAATPP